MVMSNISSFFVAHTAGYAESATAPTTQTGPAANLAIYVPFATTSPETWTRGWWYNGSVATNQGNVAVGIYNAAGTRLATTGAVAAAGNSVIQDAAFSASVFLSPGMYYMAWEASASGVTSCFGYAASLPRGREAGAYIQNVGSHPLPATATFATWSSQIMPVFGIARTSFAI